VTAAPARHSAPARTTETATYALAVGGTLFCALAVAADVLTLTMPSAIAQCGVAGRSPPCQERTG
jgi:hypothetical protein